jgi:hypothetical protein
MGAVQDSTIATDAVASATVPYQLMYSAVCRPCIKVFCLALPALPPPPPAPSTCRLTGGLQHPSALQLQWKPNVTQFADKAPAGQQQGSIPQDRTRLLHHGCVGDKLVALYALSEQALVK